LHTVCCHACYLTSTLDTHANSAWNPSNAQLALLRKRNDVHRKAHRTASESATMCIGKRIDVHRVIAPQPPSIPISAALRCAANAF